MKLKFIMIFAAFAFLSAGCEGKKKAAPGGGTHLAVFIPGVVSGSPTYEALAAGVEKAVRENGKARFTVIEAGYNQAEWESKLTACAASGGYDLIISSNPSLPGIAQLVAAKFPQARFMIFDGELKDNPAIFTLGYAKEEQAYALGYFAALLTREMGAPERIGLISAQHYPVFDSIISPAYRAGARAFDPAMTVETRIVGNWNDADKAFELTGALIDDGVKTILTIAGNGNEGVIKAASVKNAKVLWFDANAYAFSPGVIAGCCATYQEKAAYEKTKLFLETGTLPFGSAEQVGFADGYLDFIDDDPLYLTTVSESTRKTQSALVEKLRNGDSFSFFAE